MAQQNTEWEQYELFDAEQAPLPPLTTTMPLLTPPLFTEGQILKCPVCRGEYVTLEGTRADYVPGFKPAKKTPGTVASYSLLFGCMHCHKRGTNYPDEAKFEMKLHMGGGQTAVTWEVTPAVMGIICLEE